MALSDEATIGLLSLLVTAVIALGTFIAWLLRQCQRGNLALRTRRLQDPESGSIRRDSQPSFHAPLRPLSANLDPSMMRTTSDIITPGSLPAATTTVSVLPGSAVSASGLTASQAAT
ncbi:hypothetical protein MN608_11376 [Microdochium nivale]|nr:hypothetical protein MN608_11376 [Microdochium nivale]